MLTKRQYKSVTFQAVEPAEAFSCQEDIFDLDELGWSMEHNSSIEALHAFLEAAKYKWASAMEVPDARYVLD